MSLRATLCRIAAALMAGGLASSAAAAEPVAPADIAGWWLAVDDVQPRYWRAHTGTPTEELLVIDAAGRADTRMMVFNPIHPLQCVMQKACSDAPLLQHATFAVADDLLTFQPPVADDEVHILTEPRALRPVVVTSAPGWLMRLSGGGKILVLEQPNGSAARAFARIDPVRVGRIRSSYALVGKSIAVDWRCFVAHATAGDPAFLPLQHGESPPPAWFPGFLRAASYLEAVKTAGNKPPPGMTDKTMKKWSEAPLQTLMIEKFPDTGFPQTMAESRTLNLKYGYLRARIDGLDDAAARAKIANDAKGETIALTISEAEAATLVHGRAGDPEMQKLLACP